MKTLSIIIIALATQLTGFSQPSYEQAMGQALQKFGQAKTLEQLADVAAQFNRIAEAESDKWLPPYYSSLVYSTIAFRTPNAEQKQAYAEKAQESVNKALEIAPKESEVHTLQGMVYQAFLTIDPAKNGQLYSSKMNGSFQLATKLNPENPRPYYLQGVGILNTPEQYGGGKEAAKPLLKKAMKKFNTLKKSSNLHPDWGKEDCKNSLERCQQ